MKFAVIQTGGKQYNVAEGDVISIERITDKDGNDYKEGDKVVFEEVLLLDDGKKTEVGAPTLSTKVTGEFILEKRGPKIRIQKFKSKSNYSKVTGHRQQVAQVKITSIA